jgi:hypothetical protein
MDSRQTRCERGRKLRERPGRTRVKWATGLPDRVVYDNQGSYPTWRAALVSCCGGFMALVGRQPPVAYSLTLGTVRMDNLQPAPDCQALAISTGAIGSLHTAPSAWVTRARGVGYRSARLSSGIPLSRMCAWSGRRCMARPRQCGWRAAWSVLTVLYHTRSHSRSTVR